VWLFVLRVRFLFFSLLIVVVIDVSGVCRLCDMFWSMVVLIVLDCFNWLMCCCFFVSVMRDVSVVLNCVCVMGLLFCSILLVCLRILSSVVFCRIVVVVLVSNVDLCLCCFVLVV